MDFRVFLESIYKTPLCSLENEEFAPSTQIACSQIIIWWDELEGEAPMQQVLPYFI